MSWFEADLTTLAFCWRLARADGVTIGLTSHDRDLWFQGLRHSAAPGMVPSAIETHRTMTAGSVDLQGALSSSLLTEADLAQGLWDGAHLTLHAVDWRRPDTAPVFLIRGQLGQIELAGDSFSVELTGPLAALELPATETTAPLCRAVLGDVRCRVDLRGRRVLARLVSGAGHDIVLDRSFADARFAFGQARFVSGPLAGRTAIILGQTGDRVMLADPVTVSPAGALVALTEGCDRTLATCTARFDNAANFQGEPHLPGNDLLTRYGS